MSSLVVTATIPVLAAFAIDARLIAAVGSLAVLINGVRALGGYKENWTSRTRARYAIEKEIALFAAHHGTYATSGAAAVLVETVEEICAGERDGWVALRLSYGSSRAAKTTWPSPARPPRRGGPGARAQVRAQPGQRGVRVVGPPDQRVRVDRRRVFERDAAQVEAGRPRQPDLRADQGGDVGGVGDGFEEDLGAEVRAERVDREAERGGQLGVVGGPFGAGHQAGHPDPVPGQLVEPQDGGVRQRVRGAGEQLERLVEDQGRLDAVGQLPDGHRAERRVDRTVPDRRDRRVGVGQRRDFEGDVRVRAVEAAQQRRRPQPCGR